MLSQLIAHSSPSSGRVRLISYLFFDPVALHTNWHCDSFGRFDSFDSFDSFEHFERFELPELSESVASLSHIVSTLEKQYVNEG